MHELNGTHEDLNSISVKSRFGDYSTMSVKCPTASEDGPV